MKRFEWMAWLAAGILFPAGMAYAGEEIVLFDGTSLDHWQDAKGGKPGAGWVIEPDGALFRKELTGDLLTKAEFANFELSWEWKIGEGGNSGVKYWVNAIDGQNLGFEYQLIDDLRHSDAKNGPKRQTGALYDIKGPAESKPVKPAGEWNSSRLVVQGTRIEHWLNGERVVQVDTAGPDWPALFGASKYVKHRDKGFAPGKGRILLQDHRDPVWFRNIRLKQLDVE